MDLAFVLSDLVLLKQFRNSMKIILAALFLSSPLLATEPKSDFHSLCKATFQFKKEKLSICDEVQSKLFSKTGTSDIAPVKPTDLKAKESPIDGKVEFLAFNDPNYLPAIAYCYFVYRNWISPTTFSPDDMASNASGFSILNEDLDKYQTWLKTNTAGKQCESRVLKESEVSVVNLADTLKNKVALIGLNPYASLQQENATIESVMQDMMLTLNHERIHAYHVACPEFEKWSIKEWEKLPSAKKNDYMKKYPSYNWTVPKIAGREYIGFLFEATPEMINPHVAKCKL